MRKVWFMMVGWMIATSTYAQIHEEQPTPLDPFKGLGYKVEAQGSFSSDKTPLWLNANKFGLSSLEQNNGYLRAAVERPLAVDEERKWGIGYGLDLAVPFNYTSKFVVQQAYVEGRWLHGSLSIGSKEYPMELRNNNLSSGVQTLGINSRPVPQVRLALHDWAIPGTKGWLKLRGHIAYGMLTDENWQKDFAGEKGKHQQRVKYHSKAGYLTIGNEERFFPFSAELGLEMGGLFGGTAYIPQADGSMLTLTGESGLKGLWHAFVPGGTDAGETTYTNASGNTLGSWVARLNWDEDTWRVSVYADKFFEDHSGMLQVDKDGYQTGENWQAASKRTLLIYDFKDWMLGAEFHFKYDRPIQSVVFEYIYTKYQSGPIYHDHTPTMADHIGGRDNYYDHYMYTGWTHWGQVIGHPLFMSPIYNEDGELSIKNSRFIAFHLGVDGVLNPQLSYRAMVTYQNGVGTYEHPFTKMKHNVSALAEVKYDFDKGWLDGWSVKGAFGMDAGGLLGHNYGGQLTIAKSGLLTKRKKGE